MLRFGWISDSGEPRVCWDLRALGWRLEGACSGRMGLTPVMAETMAEMGLSGSWPMLCDFRRTSPALLSACKGLRRRTVLLGVDGGLERAGLLAAQFAEALPSTINLHELAQRTTRVLGQAEAMPRYREVGPVRLDLFHRDVFAHGRWLGLHPREFALLWRLAEKPGARLSRRQLLADVWRLQHDPETNRVEVHVSRLRGKLATAGLQTFVATDPRGGYHLVV